MTCPSKPHLHLELECPACCESGEYILLEPADVMDCLHCGFELQIPEEQAKGIKGYFENRFSIPRILLDGAPTFYTPEELRDRQKELERRINALPAPLADVMREMWRAGERILAEMTGQPRAADDERHGYSGA